MPIRNLHIPLRICPVDHYCLNTVVNACPAGTTSVVGSNSFGDCTNVQGTPEPTSTTTTPTTQTTDSTVTFTATLQMTLVEFNTTVREAYTTGVALAFSTQVSNVVIGTVTEVVTRRRLLATSIDVETIVTVPSTQAETLANSTTIETLGNELETVGIPVGDVSAPVVETVLPQTTSPPTTSPPTTSPPTTSPVPVETTPTPYVPPAVPPAAPYQGEWVDVGC